MDGWTAWCCSDEDASSKHMHIQLIGGLGIYFSPLYASNPPKVRSDAFQEIGKLNPGCDAQSSIPISVYDYGHPKQAANPSDEFLHGGPSIVTTPSLSKAAIWCAPLPQATATAGVAFFNGSDHVFEAFEYCCTVNPPGPPVSKN
jgi:hypothetical protein